MKLKIKIELQVELWYYIIDIKKSSYAMWILNAWNCGCLTAYCRTIPIVYALKRRRRRRKCNHDNVTYDWINCCFGSIGYLHSLALTSFTSKSNSRKAKCITICSHSHAHTYMHEMNEWMKIKKWNEINLIVVLHANTATILNIYGIFNTICKTYPGIEYNITYSHEKANELNWIEADLFRINKLQQCM